VIAGGQLIGGWRPTNNAYAQVGGLPPGVTIEILVRAIDAAHNIGDPASVFTRLRAKVGYTAEEIWIQEGIDLLERYANEGSLRVVGGAAATSAFRTSLKKLARFAGRAGGILTFIGSFLADPGDLHCEQGPFMGQAKQAFITAGRALQSSGAASGSIVKSRDVV
jgi:hypothetical protein